MSDLYNRLCGIGSGISVQKDVSMQQHTTFRVGGPADYLVTPVSEEQLAGVIRACREENTPYYLVGNGSNLLVGDGGYRGVIIQLYKNWNAMQINGTVIHAQAGAMLSVVAKSALASSLGGFEFASGIPGTLGGAVVMNAGAYGGEMKDVIRCVRMMASDGTISEMSGSDMQFGYRTSYAAKNDCIVLSAEMELYPAQYDEIHDKMESLRQKRVEKQPLDLPSAGSTFKRPEGYFAGKLIMDAGLSGYTVGGAQVSPKHCGFVVNKGGASAADIRQLMQDVQEKVYEMFGVMLEPEVKMLGEFV